ncbi:MAG: OsmC family protein, partial [Clostridiales bacterium]|nr:OsmC family protein [Clostridiales bacterium]
LSACAATTMVSLLRNKMKRTVTDIRAEAVGDVREKHPKAFEHIQLTIDIASPDATGEEAETALQVTEEKLCPVWAMIRGNVEVDARVRLRQEP